MCTLILLMMNARPRRKDLVVEQVQRRILFLRGHKVMLDSDLAELYGVETKVLGQAVRRNAERFPEDFMFQLTWEESLELSRSQFVTLKRGRNIKYRPFVFTSIFETIRQLMAPPAPPRRRIGFHAG